MNSIFFQRFFLWLECHPRQRLGSMVPSWIIHFINICTLSEEAPLPPKSHILLCTYFAAVQCLYRNCSLRCACFITNKINQLVELSLGLMAILLLKSCQPAWFSANNAMLEKNSFLSLLELANISLFPLMYPFYISEIILTSVQLCFL